MTTGSVLGDPTDVFVVLRRDQERWLGRLLAPRAGGTPRVAFPEDHAPSHLPLGTVVSAGLATRTMGRPAQCRARLHELAWGDGIVALEMELDDPTIWSQVMPDAYHRAADRREWPRLAPRMAADVVVPVRTEVGPRSGRMFAAYLVDASRGGVGLRFPLQAEPRLCLAPRFLVTLQAPNGPEHRVCSVRHRKLLPLGVRYGLAFDGPPTEPPDLSYEPLWTCPGCAFGPLLGDSHAHCPQCGTDRSHQPCTFPEWDALVAAEEHPCTGVDRTCLRCGTPWSRECRNCGHCGTRLPQVDY